MSGFCFSIFTGISVFYIAFVLPNFLVSFEKASTLTCEKLRLCGLNAFLMGNTCGRLQNFVITFIAG